MPKTPAALEELFEAASELAPVTKGGDEPWWGYHAPNYGDDPIMTCIGCGEQTFGYRWNEIEHSYCPVVRLEAALAALRAIAEAEGEDAP